MIKTGFYVNLIYFFGYKNRFWDGINFEVSFAGVGVDLKGFMLIFLLFSNGAMM